MSGDTGRVLLGWVLIAASAALVVFVTARIVRANAGRRILWWRRTSQDRTDSAISFVSVLCFGIGFPLIRGDVHDSAPQSYVALGMLALIAAILIAFSWHNHLVARQSQPLLRRRPRPY